MPSLFSRLKGNGKLKSKKGALDQLANQQPQKPRWDDAWTRKTIEPEEVVQLIRFCTEELKARGMTSKVSGPAAAAPALRRKRAALPLRPVPQQANANGTLQLSTSHSCSSLSARPPTRAPSVPLCDTFSTAKMAARCSAARPWPRSCG
jgi:hypothetical protein